jgi:hypothetical protein
MENLVLVVRRQAYNVYHCHPELFEPIFPLFQMMADGEYVMRDVAAATNVRITTPYSWRKRCRTNPQWRPSGDHFCEKRRVFSDDIEAIFADFIRINFVELGRPLTRVTLQPLILIPFQDLLIMGF